MMLLSPNQCTQEVEDMGRLAKTLRGKYCRLRIKKRKLIRQGKDTSEITRLMAEVAEQRKILFAELMKRRREESNAWQNRDTSIGTRFQESAKRETKVQGGLCNHEYQPRPALGSR
jgi:hypothetical protein